MTTSAEPVGRSAPHWGRIARNVLIVAAVAALYWQAWVKTEANLTEFFTSFHNLARIVGQMFPPDWSVLHASITGAIVTFDTALLGTTIAFVSRSSSRLSQRATSRRTAWCTRSSGP